MAVKSRNKRREVKASFKGGVYVSASFERTKDPVPNNAYSHVEKLYAIAAGDDDKEQGIWADANCGDHAFVCRIDEIPAIIEFLQKIADGVKAK